MQIKPCPFCNGTNIKFSGWARVHRCWFRCDDCGATGPISVRSNVIAKRSGADVDRGLAVDLWNTRMNIGMLQCSGKGRHTDKPREMTKYYRKYEDKSDGTKQDHV